MGEEFLSGKGSRKVKGMVYFLWVLIQETL